MTLDAYKAFLAKKFAGVRHGLPLIKKVVGVFGDRICVKNSGIFINKKKFGSVVKKSSGDLVLPALRACKRLKRGQVYVLGESRDSFDSRYLGIVSSKDIQKIDTVIYF